MSTNNSDYLFKFYEFLIGTLPIEDFESFIYLETDLEQKLNDKIYIELINFNFKKKNASEKLSEFIKNKIIEVDKFETWKLKTALNNFLNQPEEIDFNLHKLYHLYCGQYQENGSRIYAYNFLGNLGLNYFYWAEEGYLRIKFGENWNKEYERIKTEFAFYHEQLKFFAIEILSAIENKEIQILNNGTYIISPNMKIKLESDDAYNLKFLNK